MAMTPIEQISFFSESRDHISNGLEVARRTGNQYLLALNYRQAFKAELMQGLLRWRHNIGSPRQDFERAIEVASEAIEDLDNPDSPAWLRFPVSLPPVLSVLLGKLPGELVKHVPPTEAWSVCEGGMAREASLALALAAPEKAPSFLEQVRRLRRSKDEQLAQESHELYLEALAGSSSIEPAELLYKRRQKDAYYSGGEAYYGGGPDNTAVVDFMLGAVIRHVGAPVASIHAWRWD